MNVELILEALRETFPNERLEVRAVPIDETFITLPPGCVHQAVQVLVRRFGLYHLSTITGDDIGREVVLLYHFWEGRGLTLRTVLPAVAPANELHIDTVTDLIPGAAFYEREVCEMLGVTFDGLAGPHTLLLPDDWDAGPPLRRQQEGEDHKEDLE